MLKTSFKYVDQPPVRKIHIIARVIYNAKGISKYRLPFFFVFRNTYIFDGKDKAIHISSSMNPNIIDTSFSEPKS